MLNGLSEIFQHLGRDVMIYMIPGLVVLLDLAYLDHLYNTQVYDNLKDIPCLWIVFIGVLYVLGHINIGICTLWSRIKDRKTNEEDEIEKQVKIFSSQPRLYEQYIERYDNLRYFRLNLKYAFLLTVIINMIAMSIASLINGSGPLPIIKCVLSSLYGMFCVASKRAKDSFEARLKVLSGKLDNKTENNI